MSSILNFLLTLTDGVTTLFGVSKITVSGGTVSGTPSNATITITGGGGGGLTVNAQVTPGAGPTWSTAAQLSYGVTPVTQPSNGDSVALPSAVAGSIVFAFFVGGGTNNTAAVWPKFGTLDTINGIAGATDFFDWPVDATGKTVPLVIASCFTDGAWLFCGPAD